MRLAKGIAAAACFLVGLWLMLRAAGLLTTVLHAGPRWWPVLPAAAGAAIFVRSPGPGPHHWASIGLIGASGVAFAITRHLIAVTVWPFVVSAGLMAAGLALAYLAVRPSPAPATDRTQRIVMAFRSQHRPAASGDLARVRVYLFCGRLELDVTGCLSPKSLPDEPLMIEIVACLGNVMVVAPDVTVYHHKAFVIRIGQPIQRKVLRDEDTDGAAVAIATLALLGDADFRIQNSASAAPDD